MNLFPVKDETRTVPSFLTLQNGKQLAYHLSEGALPGVVFLSGFRSDMTGTKALYLEQVCRNAGHRFLRFDYIGHGQSSGEFKHGCIGDWKQDVLDMLDHVATGSNVLVGSSMGGWLMLLVAQERKQMVAGLLGIASAPDFTEDLIAHVLRPEQKKEIEEQGVIYIPDCYGSEPYPITKHLIEEGKNHALLKQEGGIPIDCPVRLVHGLRDEDVPWRYSQKLMENLHSTDVELTLVKNAGHRMSEPEQLETIAKTWESLMKAVQTE